VLILGGEGYLGSSLADNLRTNSVPVRSVDVGLPAAPAPAKESGQNFQTLTEADLAEFTSIVLLAGHSSVAACDNSPAAAFANNVSAFVDLVHKLRGQQLIFASTISVYVDSGGRLSREDDPLPEPVSFYDFHKQTIERYARLAYPNYYALRLGTVCGPGPRLRTELLLNSLVRSALESREIQVANRAAHRPLLGINDFCRAVHAIVTRPVDPGCYNLASVNVRIGEVADYVAGRFRVPCREVLRENKYDIRVDTRKFQEAAGMKFADTVDSLVDALQTHYAAGLR
jgi:nucleoside-diphosphate-sugar epimerase